MSLNLETYRFQLNKIIAADSYLHTWSLREPAREGRGGGVEIGFWIVLVGVCNLID
jgi:hypothetical protein